MNYFQHIKNDNDAQTLTLTLSKDTSRHLLGVLHLAEHRLDNDATSAAKELTAHLATEAPSFEDDCDACEQWHEKRRDLKMRMKRSAWLEEELSDLSCALVLAAEDWIEAVD